MSTHALGVGWRPTWRRRVSPACELLGDFAQQSAARQGGHVDGHVGLVDQLVPAGDRQALQFVPGPPPRPAVGQQALHRDGVGGDRQRDGAVGEEHPRHLFLQREGGLGRWRQVGRQRSGKRHDQAHPERSSGSDGARLLVAEEGGVAGHRRRGSGPVERDRDRIDAPTGPVIGRAPEDHRRAAGRAGHAAGRHGGRGPRRLVGEDGRAGRRNRSCCADGHGSGRAEEDGLVGHGIRGLAQFGGVVDAVVEGQLHMQVLDRAGSCPHARREPEPG